VSTFRLYLWKEWREQRGALAALGLSLPVLVFAVGRSLPRSQVTSSLFVGIVGALALLTSLVVVGGELLASDRRRGLWIERLPRGLEGAFPAKLVVFVLISLAALLYGHALGIAAAMTRRADFLLRLTSRLELEHLILPAALASALALWTFAASAWCSRGALSVVAGALLAAVAASPAWALWFLFRHEYSPEPWEVTSTLIVLLSAPVLSAWVGFTRGQRLGRGTLSPAWRGGGIGLVAALPLLAWSLVQLERRDDLDFASEHCFLGELWISPDGRTGVLVAFMHERRGWQRAPSHSLWIDFERRQAHDLGIPDASLHALLSLPEGPDQHPRPMARLVTREVAFDLRDDQKGPREICTSQDARFAFPAGLGWGTLVPPDFGRSYHDPFTGVVRSQDELPSYPSVWIGPQGWFIHADEWYAYDPQQDTLESLEWIDIGLEAIAMSVDGRLVLTDERGSLALADLRSDALIPIAGTLEGLYPRSVEDDLDAPDEILVRSDHRIYRIDLRCLELVPFGLDEGEHLERRLADGTCVVSAPGGIEWRASDGTLRRVVRYEELELTEEGMP